MREGVAALLFVEMLFWKSARDTEAVRDQYNWQVRDYGSIYLCQLLRLCLRPLGCTSHQQHDMST